MPVLLSIYRWVASFFESIHPYARPLLFVLAAVGLGLLVRWILRRWVNRVSGLPSMGNIVFQHILGPIPLIVGLLAAGMIADDYPAPQKVVFVIRTLLWSLALLRATHALARIVVELIQNQTQKSPQLQTNSLIQRLTWVAIYMIGLSLVLNMFGLNVAAIITALGVGGIAIALALQDTLSNLFAGIYITVSKQIKVGNYIRASDVAEGVISDIVWRSTIITRLDGNSVIVPNNVLSQATILRMDEQAPATRIALYISVDREAVRPSDMNGIVLKAVEAVSKALTQAIDPVKQVRTTLVELRESSYEYHVVFYATDSRYQLEVRHLFISELEALCRDHSIRLRSVTNHDNATFQFLANRTVERTNAT